MDFGLNRAASAKPWDVLSRNGPISPGQPRYLLQATHRKTGGFASPSFNGFANSAYAD
jgi:hypothetical protein